MTLLRTMIMNYWTTIGGFLLGVLYYLGQVQTFPPATSTEWFHFVVAALMAGFGAVAKDATSGSKPGDPPALTVGGAETKSGVAIVPTPAATDEARVAAHQIPKP